MFRNEVNTIGVLASSKVDHMKNHPARYFTLTLLAGMFIGFGVLLDFSLKVKELIYINIFKVLSAIIV